MEKLNHVLYNKRGFTLVEVLAVVVILSVISAPIFYYFFKTHNQTTANKRLIEAQGQANSAVRLILDDLRKVEAATVDPSDPSSTATIQVNPAGYPNTIVILQAGGTIQIAYGLSSGNLYRLVSSGAINLGDLTTTGKVIANNVQDFIPNQSIDPNKYSVELTVTPKSVGSITVRNVKASINFTPRFEIN